MNANSLLEALNSPSEYREINLVCARMGYITPTKKPHGE
jgi:hypothetical protein